MFTSTMPGEGKSFVSRNFAVTLAMTNKKVVLLDMDLRKRTLSKTLDLTTKNGVSTWLSGKNNSVSELVQSSNIHAMFDIISAGIVPPNPSELLMSDRLPVLVEELKKQYDYIILDCVPALVVADSSIIGRVADLTIYVIRNGMLDRRYLPELENSTGRINSRTLRSSSMVSKWRAKSMDTVTAMVMDTVTAMEWNREERKNVMSSIKLLIE